MILSVINISLTKKSSHGAQFQGWNGALARRNTAGIQTYFMTLNSEVTLPSSSPRASQEGAAPQNWGA